jgi:hypothetical protein
MVEPEAMIKIPLTVVHYSDPHPLKSTGGVQTFARNLRLIFDQVLFMAPRERDIPYAMKNHLPVICDNQLVADWPDGFPVIGFQHGVAAVKFQATRTVGRWLLARAQKHAAGRPGTLWVANSEWVAATFQKLYGNENEHIVYYPVDTERFDGKLDNQNSRLILHDARTKHKGVRLIKHLKAAYTDWQIEPLDCPNSEVHNRMRKARAFIHLSVYEGNSIVCNEAMAMNLPCMFTRVGLMQDPHCPSDVYIVDPEEMFHNRDRLVEEFGKFLQTLDTRTYNPRAWTLKNATQEIAAQRWRRVMVDFQSMSGWDLGLSALV